METRQLLAAALPGNTIGYSKPGDQFAGIVADIAHNRVFVGRAGVNALIVIDTATAVQVATIPLSAAPGSVAITPDGASILIAEPAKHQVEVVSTATLKSQRVLNVGAPLLQLAAAVGGKFYALATTDAAIADPYDLDAAYASRSIGQFDLTTGHRDRVLGLANDTDRFVRTDTAGRRLYVGFNSGFDGSGADLADVRVYDVADPATLKPLAPLMGPQGGRLADVFADASTGRLYTANAQTQVVERRDADGTVAASWSSPFAGEFDNRQMLGLAGAAGLPFVFGLFTDWQKDQNLSIVAFDAANGAVRQTYALPDLNASAAMAVTPNGRLAYVGRDELTLPDDSGDAWALGLLGATSLGLASAHNVVSGTVFNDANGDGVRQAGEDGWLDEASDPPGVVVYADLNGNGRLDANDPDGFATGDEPHVWLDDVGTYRLTMPATSGAYAIRMIVDPYPSPYRTPFVATKGGLLRTLSLGDGAQAGGVNFGIAPGVRVIGSVFADVDGNGSMGLLADGSSLEPNVGGAQVFLDLNDDGKRGADEPICDAVPGDNADGSFLTDWAYNLVAPAGAIVVRLLNPKGYALSMYTPASVPIDGIAGARYTADFAVQPQLKTTGTLYRDANANGKRDAGEGPLAGARVWLDLNGNGKFNKGEPTAVSAVDGRYAIAVKQRGIAPYTVLIRDASARPLRTSGKPTTIRFTDWKQSLTGDYGAFAPATLRVTAFLDLDRNRKRNKGDRWLANTIAYLDLDRDGKQDKNEPAVLTDALGVATFSNLVPGDYAVRLRVSSKLNATRGTAFGVTVIDGETRAVTAAVRVG